MTFTTPEKPTQIPVTDGSKETIQNDFTTNESGETLSPEEIIGNLEAKLNSVKTEAGEAVQAVQASQTGEVPAETSEQLTAQEEIQAQKAESLFSRLSKKQWAAIGAAVFALGFGGTGLYQLGKSSPEAVASGPAPIEKTQDIKTHDYSVEKITYMVYHDFNSLGNIYGFNLGNAPFQDSFKELVGPKDPNGLIMTRFNHFYQMDQKELKQLEKTMKSDLMSHINVINGLNGNKAVDTETYNSFIKAIVDYSIVSELSTTSFIDSYVNITPVAQLN